MTTAAIYIKCVRRLGGKKIAHAAMFTLAMSRPTQVQQVADETRLTLASMQRHQDRDQDRDRDRDVLGVSCMKMLSELAKSVSRHEMPSRKRRLDAPPKYTPHSIDDILGRPNAGPPTSEAPVADLLPQQPFFNSPPAALLSPPIDCWMLSGPFPQAAFNYDPDRTPLDKLSAGSIRHSPRSSNQEADDVSLTMSSDDANGNTNGKTPKRKHTRPTFSGHQIFALEKAFEHTKYLAGSERAQLAYALGMSEGQVKVWFQNRRCKMRKKLSADFCAKRKQGEKGDSVKTDGNGKFGTDSSARPCAVANDDEDVIEVDTVELTA